MGVQDRDWWRERRDRLHPDDPRSTRRARTAPPSRGRGLLLLMLVLVVLAAILWRQRAPGAVVPGGTIPQRLNPACSDPFPAAGAILPAGGALIDGQPSSATQFVNRTPVDRMVDLLAGEQVLISIAVPANGAATVPLPAGAYGWRLRHGAAWCAASAAFVREQRTIVTNSLQIVPTSMLSIYIDPDARPGGFVLHTSDRPVLSNTPLYGDFGSARSIPGGGLLITRAADGHYYLDGTIEGLPVRFMIDTGATGVAIPAELARRLGYYSGPEVVSNTANGRATGYAIRARRLGFGPFFADDVKVIALSELDRPLLGMSLLQSLDIRQTDAGLELRAAR